MINFKIENIHRLPLYVFLILFVFQSCTGNSKKIDIPSAQLELNRYKLFEEPSTELVQGLKFYFLAAAYGSAENTYLLSIRA